ncbi:hypothetical protein I5E68_09745 [Novosphingobium sp. YJ-S2-02]|uniref:Uncharacterized protein n=1 Tax=Novosphingobium aureum TaxID=2792964 RepID=A0A931MKV8_9SPHN|nr:hypothetical protein [Novosphingobium aureum]MBH0113228.1 hypothetical protein [Novosphingobium aureum]
MSGQRVSEEYLDGIREGRAWFKRYGMSDARENLDNLERTARTFAASSPVGQMLRGERDFWRLQLRKHKGKGKAV